MNWQIFLTCWMLVQLIGSTIKAVSDNERDNKTKHQLMGALAGTIVKFIGMFACLYFGGFYSI